MRLPRTIHFAGFDYTVKEVDRLDGQESWGRTQMDTGQIFIERNMSDSKKLETLIHELIHIAYRHTASPMTNDRDEEILKPWSMNIYGILKDNGLLAIGEEKPNKPTNE